MAALVAALAGAAVTLTVYAMLVSREQELIRVGLQQRGEELKNAVQSRVDANFESVDALASFFTASEQVTWQEFKIFADHLLAYRRGVQSLQWLPRIPREAREAHESTPLTESPYLRDVEVPDIDRYQIRELDGDAVVPAPQREAYYPIYYLSPYEPVLWGVDMAAIPSARRAMEEARMTGRIRTSGAIRGELVWLFAYVDRGVDGFEQGPSGGFVAAAFQGDRILDEVLAWFWPADVDIEVWDDSASPPRLIYTRNAAAEGGVQSLGGEPLQHTGVIDVGQRRWRVVSAPSERYIDERRTAGPTAVLAGGSVATVLLVAYLLAVITRIQRAREEAADRTTRARQQTVVARLGLAALSEPSVQQFMQRVCRVLAKTLDVEYTKVLELQPDHSAFRLRAGVGWRPGLVGNAVVGAERASQAGYTLLADEPVVVEDLPNETRFSGPPVLLEHGVVSGMSVIIHEEHQPFGVLGAHTTRHRQFTDNDIAFMQAVANVLGQAVVQRRVETELRESEQRFRTMADAAPVLIWLADTKGHCTYFNRQWLMFTGRRLEEEVGEGWMEGVHDRDRAEMHRSYRNAVRRREPFRMEYRLRRADGEYRWVADEGLPRFTAGDDFVGYIGSCVDITDQKVAEQQLRNLNEMLERRVGERTAELQRANEALERQIAERERAEAKVKRANEALERSNRELEQFAYIASHDLQEPLRKIEGFGDMLLARAGEAVDEEAKDYLARMTSASKRMRALIHGLLAYSRVTTRVQPFVDVDLNALVEEVIEDLEIRIRETEAKVDVQTLPTVHGDPLQLRQLFQNLIGNALKFHKPGQSPHVEVLADDGDANSTDAPGGARCRVCVRDDGIGIEEKYIDQLFVPFQRPIHARGQYEGTGIGLAICRKIAETHGGQITVESSPGEGSTFRVSLPCAAERGGHEA